MPINVFLQLNSYNVTTRGYLIAISLCIIYEGKMFLSQRQNRELGETFQSLYAPKITITTSVSIISRYMSSLPV